MNYLVKNFGPSSTKWINEYCGKRAPKSSGFSRYARRIIRSLRERERDQSN